MKKASLSKKVVSLFLTLVMSMSLTIPAMAADVTAAGGQGTTQAILNQEATTFSVTLPTSLPINVSSDHVISVADDIQLVNNGFGPISVTSVSVEVANGWSISDFTTDFRTVKVGAKEFGMQLNGANVPESGVADTSVFPVINGQSYAGMTYDAVVAAQSMTINETVANVVFTVGWKTAIIPVLAGAVIVGDLTVRTSPTVQLVDQEGNYFGAISETDRVIISVDKDDDGIYEDEWALAWMGSETAPSGIYLAENHGYEGKNAIVKIRLNNDASQEYCNNQVFVIQPSQS